MLRFDHSIKIQLVNHCFIRADWMNEKIVKKSKTAK